MVVLTRTRKSRIERRFAKLTGMTNAESNAFCKAFFMAMADELRFAHKCEVPGVGMLKMEPKGNYSGCVIKVYPDVQMHDYMLKFLKDSKSNVDDF